MNLNQHMKQISQYRLTLEELKDIKTLPSSTKWEARPLANVGVGIPLSPDYMNSLLKARISELEFQAKEMARTLGIDYEETETP